MTGKQSVSEVVNKKLCNTCGACYGVCPAGAIHYEETTSGCYLPIVDKETCIECGLCFDVCPGINFGNTLMSRIPEDPFAGNVLETFVGKATDKMFFENSQSGGIVSAILVHAMETVRIKAAVTVSMEPGIPPRPVVRIARSRQDIFKSQKSKYCPVPLLSFLRSLEKKDCPVAVVGVSCQIHGLRNILDMKTKLNSKIAFTVGLVCDRVMTYAAVDYLVAKSGTDKSIASLLHFRDKSVASYPGDVHVVSVNGKSFVIPSSTRMKIKDHFTPARCRICFDKMNVFSDITVGDPHGLESIDRQKGESMLVVRTPIGQEIVLAAKADSAINIRPIEYARILKGQGVSGKKEQWHGYVTAWKYLGHELPNYCERITNHANPPGCQKKYLHDLQYALSLDDFASRKALVQFVEKSLRKKQIADVFLYPALLIKRIMMKLLNVVAADKMSANKKE